MTSPYLICKHALRFYKTQVIWIFLMCISDRIMIKHISSFQHPIEPASMPLQQIQKILFSKMCKSGFHYIVWISDKTHFLFSQYAYVQFISTN